MEQYKKVIEQLKNGEIERIEVKKEEFLQFRDVLVHDDHFKHFRGEAKQGGNVTFTYMENARS